MADATELLERIVDAYSLDGISRELELAKIQIEAKKADVLPIIKKFINKCEKSDKAAAKQQEARNLALNNTSEIELERNNRGIADSMDNFFRILTQDPKLAGIKYNLLSNSPEIETNGIIRNWTDADEAAVKHYIEVKYGIYNSDKFNSCLKEFFVHRSYHPIRNIVDSLEWDGTDRISQFLTLWAKADNSEYVCEVSRLIFAGGIHRLYEPGCKFDDVPVLIGTRQGEGKSSLVRWLAIHDSYYKTVNDVEGQRGIEQLSGAWICEIAELLAVTKAKEQGAVKDFITCQADSYRKPYDRNVSKIPRSCIFIGTTNIAQFLKDKTGNRRFYPVTVHSSGYDLYDHEQECRDYIIQCWAEAKAKYSTDFMKPFANRRFIKIYEEMQDAAMEDDWRVGVIEKYINSKCGGSYICTKEICNNALSDNSDFPKNPDPKTSAEISQIMQRLFPDYKRIRKNIPALYGCQRYWLKPLSSDNSLDELPL